MSLFYSSTLFCCEYNDDANLYSISTSNLSTSYLQQHNLETINIDLIPGQSHTISPQTYPNSNLTFVYYDNQCTQLERITVQEIDENNNVLKHFQQGVNGAVQFWYNRTESSDTSGEVTTNTDSVNEFLFKMAD